MILIISCLAVIAYAIAPPFLKSGPYDETAETKWFDQRLDHSDPATNLKWKQRYHLYQDYYVEGNTKAVVLYICGEWTCNGLGGGAFTFEIAKQFNARVLVLEHRFYGKSQPLGPDSWQPSGLKYLSVHQALDDLAYFISETKRNEVHGITADLPWIAVGGSYPGALSAWFRFKYPHLTVGNLASSAVINTVLDFYQFDQQIRTSTTRSGFQCPYYLSLMNSFVDSQLADPKRRDTFKASFRASKMTDNEFRFFFVDTIVQQVQSGKRTGFCASFENITVPDMVELIRQITLQSDDYLQYGSYYLRDTTVNFDYNHRQWYYQCCTEVAYLQTAPQTRESLRSYQLDLSFYRQWCNDAYKTGEEDVWPRVDLTESYFGGIHLNVDHLIMTNGAEDPWQQASLTTNVNNQKVDTILIDCENCAHCVDLKAPSDNDSDALKAARVAILGKFQTWVDEYWNK